MTSTRKYSVQGLSTKYEQNPKLRRYNIANHDFVPTAIGVLDVSVIVAYVAAIAPPTWYIGVLAVKIVLAIGHLRRLAITPRQMFFLGAVLVGVIPGTLLADNNGDGLTRVLGFCTHILLTTALIGNNGLVRYLKTVAFVISVTATFHTVMCLINIVPNHYGRYLYFKGSHPNLGSEIGVMGLLAAALTMSWRKVALISAPVVLSIGLMQGRAALLAVFLILAIRFGQWVLVKGRRSPLTLLTFAACGLLAFSAAAAMLPSIWKFTSTLFMLSDQYRGVGTGFVGRDHSWAVAMLAFSENPVFGVGLDYFSENALLSPHNYFLYALSTMGVVGLTVFTSVLIWQIFQLFKVDQKSAYILAGILPLFFFNDRMLNINPYPFIFYIILISFPSSSISQSRQNYSTKNIQ